MIKSQTRKLRISANKSIGLNLYTRYTAEKNASRGTGVGLRVVIRCDSVGPEVNCEMC